MRLIPQSWVLGRRGRGKARGDNGLNPTHRADGGQAGCLNPGGFARALAPSRYIQEGHALALQTRQLETQNQGQSVLSDRAAQRLGALRWTLTVTYCRHLRGPSALVSHPFYCWKLWGSSGLSLDYAVCLGHRETRRVRSRLSLKRVASCQQQSHKTGGCAGFAAPNCGCTEAMQVVDGYSIRPRLSLAECHMSHMRACRQLHALRDTVATGTP